MPAVAERPLLVCKRIADGPPVVRPSVRRVCQSCLFSVWRPKRPIEMRRILCTVCADRKAREAAA